jgi:hypothetical protein
MPKESHASLMAGTHLAGARTYESLRFLNRDLGPCRLLIITPDKVRWYKAFHRRKSLFPEGLFGFKPLFIFIILFFKETGGYGDGIQVYQ